MPFHIKTYLTDPLTENEISELCSALNTTPSEIIRHNDLEKCGLSITGKNDRELINLIIKHPILLQRPILHYKNNAIIGRPPEKLLDIF